MTPEVGFIAGVLVTAAILGSRWAAEERKRAAELETIINLIQQLARLETQLETQEETTDGSSESNDQRARGLNV